MSKRRKTLVLPLIAVMLGAAVIVLFAGPGQTEESMLPSPARETGALGGLGITYLPVVSSTSAEYDLNVDSGALVTEVKRGSLAHMAGLREGDLIVSYNRVRLEDGVPLLGMMRRCRVGSPVEVEVLRNGRSVKLSFIHAAQ